MRGQGGSWEAAPDVGPPQETSANERHQVSISRPLSPDPQRDTHHALHISPSLQRLTFPPSFHYTFPSAPSLPSIHLVYITLFHATPMEHFTFLFQPNITISHSPHQPPHTPISSTTFSTTRTTTQPPHFTHRLNQEHSPFSSTTPLSSSQPPPPLTSLAYS